MSYPPTMTIEDVVREHTLKTYAHFRKVKTTTAKVLGISVRTLDDKLEKYQAENTKHEGGHADFRSQRQDFLRRCRGEAPAQFDTAAKPPPPGVTTHQKANAGVDVEPSSGVAEVRPVPLSEHEEIQVLLPEQAPARRAKRHG